MPPHEDNEPKTLPQALVLLFALSLAGCSAPRPDTLGLVDGKLRPCPDSPNCVLSTAPGHKGQDQAVEPLRYAGAMESARDRLLEVLRAEQRVEVVTVAQNYIHAEFTTPLMRYIDDVEFLFETQGRIDLRSASRIGRSDLGANRKRVERLRAAFQEVSG